MIHVDDLNDKEGLLRFQEMQNLLRSNMQH